MKYDCIVGGGYVRIYIDLLLYEWEDVWGLKALYILW